MIAADKFFNLDFCFSDRSSKISGSVKKKNAELAKKFRLGEGRPDFWSD